MFGQSCCPARAQRCVMSTIRRDTPLTVSVKRFHAEPYCLSISFWVGPPHHVRSHKPQRTFFISLFVLRLSCARISCHRRSRNHRRTPVFRCISCPVTIGQPWFCLPRRPTLSSARYVLCLSTALSATMPIQLLCTPNVRTIYMRSQFHVPASNAFFIFY